MDEIKPATLPLPVTVSRCLGHGDRKGEWCQRHSECARHKTISHINEPWDRVGAPYYRMCSDMQFLSFMEVVE